MPILCHKGSRRRSWIIALAGAVLVLGSGAYMVAAMVRTPSVTRQRPFTIKGDARVPLRPGSSQALNPALTNRYRFKLWVTRLTVRVSVDRRHLRAGCSVRRDFAVRQLASRAYPIGLPRRSTRRLSRLRARPRRAPLPRVRMRYLAYRNQNACKGARLRLSYRAAARRSRP